MSDVTDEPDDDDLTCCSFDEEEGCDDWFDDEEGPAALAPPVPIQSKDLIAKIYNRLGGCMATFAEERGVGLAAILAVFRVESGPYVHIPGKAIIRFENHLLYRAWGKNNPKKYAASYRHGAGKLWLGHMFNKGGTWVDSHKGDQAVEYAALARATELAGEDAALRCISIGGPQLLCRNYSIIGYDSPKSMYEAFQGTEDSHVRGLLDFVAAKGILSAMQERDWPTFTRTYNGPGQIPLYSSRLSAAYDTATKLLGTLPKENV